MRQRAISDQQPVPTRASRPALHIFCHCRAESQRRAEPPTRWPPPVPFGRWGSRRYEKAKVLAMAGPVPAKSRARSAGAE
jgi:hypothetical protein